MDSTSYIALSKQSVLQRQMANIAHNIANASTTGYRSEHMVFETMLQRSGEPRKLAFVQDVGMVRNLNEGQLNQTGNSLDLALAGPGYFSVQTDAGQAYTRAGQFGFNAEGAIVTPAGYPLLDEGGQPVTLPPDAGAVEISEDGVISNGQGILGQITTFEFENEQALERVGDTLLATDQAPVPSPNTKVMQGYLENSNVQPVLEITRLMETVRAFEGTQRLIETHHELTRRSIERVLSSS